MKKYYKLCFWGIEKFYNHKRCLKFVEKNFENHPNITHICKLKEKPFFIVKFREQVNYQQFKKQYALNKRIRAKLLSENIEERLQITQDKYVPIQQVTKNVEKNYKEATAEEIEKVKNTKIEDIVAPLHRLPYEEQVQQKIKELNSVIQHYNKAFFKDNEVQQLIKEQGKDLEQLKLIEFVECQKKREGYRSKSEFTISVDEKNNPVIGFNKGSFHNNTIMVENPKNVNIISKNTKLIVNLVESFIKQMTKNENFALMIPFDRIKQQGFWRYLIVRESDRTNQSMIVIVAKTDRFQPELVEQIKQKLIQFLKVRVINLKSLCFLNHSGQADFIPTQKPELLWGDPFYQQRIFGHLFQVSPSAFLQIHLDMCEVLYEKIIDSVRQCDVVLDLGCGIGTIGISIMKKLPNVKVIGIQICEEAVEDAKKNEPNYEVHLGRAEDHIKQICQLHKGKRIIAILDPPRAGFNKDVMLELRRCRGLDHIIYVACNAGAIQKNLLQLTLPMTKKRKAPQFVIRKISGLDLFPQTKHFEALYILERKYEIIEQM